MSEPSFDGGEALAGRRTTSALTPHLDALDVQSALGSIAPRGIPDTRRVPKLALGGEGLVAPGFVTDLVPAIR